MNQILVPYLISIFEPKMIWIYNINVGYIIYIFAGYIIQNYRFKKLSKLLIYLLGITGLLVLIIGTKNLTIKSKKLNLLHKGYLNLPCIVYSCSLFLFVKEYSYLLFSIIDKKKINQIAYLTIGPFFLHMPIKETFDKYLKFNIFRLSYRLWGGIIIYIICLIITSILKKIPLIKYIVP